MDCAHEIDSKALHPLIEVIVDEWTYWPMDTSAVDQDVNRPDPTDE
jgi:hypothetical protein